MLSKLIYHEFRATRRIFLPFFALIFALAAMNALSFYLRGTEDPELSGGLILTAYIIALVAVGIAAFVFMVRRFYSNLLGDEGYLMFTLPVRPPQLIWSKCIVAVVWFFLSAVVCILSMMILMVPIITQSTWQGWQELAQVPYEIWRIYGVHTIFLTLLFLVLAVVCCANFCMHIYACLGIGGLANNHRLGFAILAYIVIGFAETIVFNLLAGLISVLPQLDLLDILDGIVSANITGIAASYLGLVSMIVWYIVCLLVNFAVTSYLLSRRLNLQ